MVPRLIAFIHSHRGCRVEAVCSGRLEVSSWCTLPCGRTVRVCEQIDANLNAVRNWLGY